MALPVQLLHVAIEVDEPHDEEDARFSLHLPPFHRRQLFRVVCSSAPKSTTGFLVLGDCLFQFWALKKCKCSQTSCVMRLLLMCVKKARGKYAQRMTRPSSAPDPDVFLP